ncbi:MAG: Lipl32 family lipoprotein [Saprospiraceae bacterium]|uniref:Lipl32 family lipoprotein n=1 Tax=Candidatus Opimibacter skivensis TaxID=2982028 RepID=A0A9D7STY1_9BACT|nr:Lipl32 family lipoprotein [Candidatus Opimibacter skivensis]
MTQKIMLTFLICFGIGMMVNAQKLDKFGAEMGKKSLMGKDIRVPYTDLVSYFGYVKPGAAPDETRDGKKYYYLYMWIPLAAPEVGIRMVSPIPSSLKPAETDFIGPEYKANEAETTLYFDTWITLERAFDVTSAENIAKGKTSKWASYGTNDDSSELPAQPSGSKYNSLMRITSETSNPAKALVAGLYRIGFTTYKTGEVQGGFVAQVGAPVKLPGVAIASSLDGLSKLVKK